MPEKTYLFRREDSGEVIEVPFGVMIEQDRAGYITLPDGVQAKRCVYLELERDGRPEKKREKRDGTRPVVSDALGFTDNQLADFEADRKANGFSDIEFRPDPSEPRFFQVHAGSRESFNRYMKHRGYEQKSSFGGVRLTQEDLDRAREMVERCYGTA